MMYDAALIEQCTTNIAPQTMRTLVDVESSGNPYAIAAVGVDIVSQPSDREEAVEYANSLIKQGYNVSLGLGQINMHNFDSLGMTVSDAFDPCKSISAAEKVLSDCYERALKSYSEKQKALQAAFSCYYSNNFSRGFEPDDSSHNSYVGRVASRSQRNRIPSIEFSQQDVDNFKGGARKKDSQREEEVQPAKKPDVQAIEKFDSSENGGWDVFKDFNGS